MYITSTQENDICNNYFDQFVQFYYDNLKTDLQILKYKGNIPSLKEFHMDLIQRGYFASQLLIYMLALVLLDTREDASLDHFLNDDEKGVAFKRILFSNPRYLKKLEKFLRFLDQRGALDLDENLVINESI